jgi:uncharacterized tellurite resistance protein B-like protein
MIGDILKWLGGETAPERSPEDGMRIAAAALLLEAATVDDRLDDAERETIERVVERRFGMAAGEARALVAAAQQARDRTAQIFGFTRTLNERLTPPQRAEFVEMLWEVALADGALDPLEDTLLRRIAGLIHVPDRERGMARQRVLRRLGRDGADEATTED